MRTVIALLALALILFSTSAAVAAVPTQMTVQGKLTNASGDPLPPGVKTFVFRVFNAQNAGTELWPGGAGEVQFIATDAAGLWSANLGSGIALTAAVFAGPDAWLQITVNDGQAVITLPRTRLVTSAYAHRVATIDGASGGGLMSGLDMRYLNGSLSSNLGGIRWWNGSDIKSAFGLVVEGGISFQGSYDPYVNNAFGVRAPTADGSLGPTVFRVSQAGSVDCGDVFANDFITTEGYLNVYGNAFVGGYVCAQGGTNCPSDARFKDKIETLSNALESVKHLRGVRYEWRRNEFPDLKFAEGTQVGLIAQEVQEVVPQAVQKMEDGYLAVDYARLVPLLIESIKEQQKQIDELKTMLESIRQ